MKFRFPKFHSTLRHERTALALAGLTALTLQPAAAVGHWTALAHTAPDSVEQMLLLSDGTVMAANNPSSVFNGIGHDWYRLTPDGNGSYVNGTWTSRTSASFSRLFYASQVLRDGRVFVAGGEYGSGGSTAEIYDPLSDSWTTLPASGQTFKDSGSKVLPNGNVLVAPVNPSVTRGTVIYDPVANSWSAGPTTRAMLDEATWVKLPDGSILTVDPDSTTSERFIPSLNQWVDDGVVPVALYATLPGYFGETGPAFLLPDGRAFFIGGAGHTAYYTPSGNNSPGTWAAGPDVPNGLVAADAPGAMMPNGKILCAVAPAPTVDSGGNITFPTPTSFFEFDPVANAFTQVSSPSGGLTDNIPTYLATMLVVADGTVLYSHVEQGNLFYSSFGSQLYAYVPDGAPVASGKPVITGISLNGDGSYHLTGLGLNGISEGASYGDDAQMDSNFPLVRLTDGAGNVYYARTFNWSSTRVMTGNTPVSTEFRLPAFLPAQGYNLSVVANGIASDPVFFEGPVYVEFGYFGLQFGTFNFPFGTMAQGVSAVPIAGQIILEGPATSSETMTISKPMTITAIGGPSTLGL